MLYGLVRDKRELTSMELLISKKVNRSNIAEAAHMVELVQRLNKGDIVWAVSVFDFCTVSLFYAFTFGVLEKGATLRIIKQSYLDVGNGKIWRESVKEHIKCLAGVEQQAVRRLTEAFDLNPRGRAFVADFVAEMMICVLSATYSQEGILRRL